MISNKFNLKKAAALVCALAVSAAAVQSGVQASATFSSSYLDTDNISVTINTAKGHKSISPYIYGINSESDLSGLTVNAVKQTDPRISSYNWETNYSGIAADGTESNDLELIAYAGLGVAMGNATDAVKKKADAVTLTNDKDGVAALIEKYLL